MVPTVVKVDVHLYFIFNITDWPNYLKIWSTGQRFILVWNSSEVGIHFFYLEPNPSDLATGS